MFKRNTAVTGFSFTLISKTDGSAITTGTVTGYYLLDGGTQGTIAGSIVHEGNGQWSVNLLAAEMNGAQVGLLFVHTSAIPVHFTIPTVTKLVSDLVDAAAAPSAASVATTVWTDLLAGSDFSTAASIGKLLKDDIDAKLSTLSTYTGGDTSGTTTLLARLTSTRAGLLDNLDAAITSRMGIYTQPTGFLAATFPSGTIANTTNITGGVITTATNLTNAPTAGDFTSTMKTSLNAATPASVVGAVGSIGTGGITTASFAAGAINAAAIASNAITAAKIAADAIGASQLAADAVVEIQAGLSTYAGGDTSGVTTLLGRLTVTRADLLDNLDAPISGLTNLSALANLFGAPVLEVPVSGTTQFAFTLVVHNTDGQLVDLDSSPTIAATNVSGTDRSSNLSAVTHASTGRYTFTYGVVSGATEESLRITASGAISSDARYAEWIGSVASFNSLSILNTINSKLGSPTGASISEDIATVTTAVAGVQTDTNDIQSRLPATLVTGRMDSAVSAMADNVVTAEAIADSSINSATFALGCTIPRVTLADTVTTLTNLPTIPANWLTAAGIASDAGLEIAVAVRDVNNAAPAADSLGAAVNAASAGGLDPQDVADLVIAGIGTLDVNVTHMADDVFTAAAIADDALDLIGSSGGGGGSGDWTTTEKKQIRYRLGVDGLTDIPADNAPHMAAGTTLSSVPVDQDTGGVDNLRYIENSSPVGDGRVRAYLSTDFLTGHRGYENIAGEILTDENGFWRTPMMLVPGDYTFLFFKAGLPRTQRKRLEIA